LLSIGKSKARVYMETDTKVTFDAVAGVDDAKEELKEVVGFLKDPTSFGRSEAAYRKAFSSWGRPAPEKRCLRVLSQVKRACPSSPSTARSSSRCSSA
jgi:cell division protease FtsH